MSICPPPSITSTTTMMKSGLSQNEKLKALRIFIENHDEGEINRKVKLCAVVEKQLQDFKDWGLNAPDRINVLMKRISKPIFSEYTPFFYSDCAELRVAVRHNGAERLIIEAGFKCYYLHWILSLWEGRCSVLSLSDNNRDGCYTYPKSYFKGGADRDRPYLFYHGRELNGGFIFATSNTKVSQEQTGQVGWVYETTVLKRFSPAGAAGLRQENRNHTCGIGYEFGAAEADPGEHCEAQ